MSIRARRIKVIEYEEGESFNLWHDTKLMEFLEGNSDFYNSLNQDGCGVGEVSVEVLEKAIKEVELEEDLKASLQVDIDYAKKNELEYIQYYCF